MSADDTLLLFSGGLDSTTIAATMRPKLLFVDYGQLSAIAEATAARHIAEQLELHLVTVNLGMNELGSGLLSGSPQIQGAPSPEWWPYRNQFLATAGAAIALRLACSTVALGSVSTDGSRHRDGTKEFYELLDRLIAFQEGAVRVIAPAVAFTTEQLLTSPGFDQALIPWTYSCHRANMPCGDCPGCWKREQVLRAIGRRGYGGPGD
ncbi:MAG: 7-cyano-7-deazaguanine synthase [Frankiales bacterium]|nr:7-cyano-7-deazaguanine synthase [Frankiales bacterium]